MNHAIKEQISDNTLYIEVDLPVECKNYKYLGRTVAPNFYGKHQFEMLDSDMPAFYFSDPPPISIGDTVNGRKVVGIKVEEQEEWKYKNPSILFKKWFWKYSLEEIN
ncbi:MAG: hypothetical protein V3R41_06000 [Gammaproteobacteria bacterium]